MDTSSDVKEVRTLIKNSCRYRILIEAFRMGNNNVVWDEGRDIPNAILMAHNQNFGRSSKSVTNFFGNKMNDKHGSALTEAIQKVEQAQRIYDMELPNLVDEARRMLDEGEVKVKSHVTMMQGKGTGSQKAALHW